MPVSATPFTANSKVHGPLGTLWTCHRPPTPPGLGAAAPGEGAVAGATPAVPSRYSWNCGAALLPNNPVPPRLSWVMYLVDRCSVISLPETVPVNVISRAPSGLLHLKVRVLAATFRHRYRR